MNHVYLNDVQHVQLYQVYDVMHDLYLEMMVLQVVDGPPRCLLVYWYMPPKLCINPVLENEECLAVAVRDNTTVESTRRTG